MQLKRIMLVEVQDDESTSTEFNSFRQLQNYVKNKSGKIVKPPENKLLDNIFKQTVEQKRAQTKALSKQA